ncbi:DNA-directed RNA polymerase III subunit RPC7-like [Trebouxia sp. C0009 RCD-2024]
MAGRGRGRGRGRGPMMPRITDDDGNVVAAADIGPPPLFPNVELPPTLEQEPLDQRLVQRWRELSMSYRKSPYYLKPAAPKGLAADIAQYASKYKPDGMEDKKPLAMVMSLDSRYFPEELYTSKERKISTKAGSAAAQQAYWAADARKADRDPLLLERLAQMETELGSKSPIRDADGNVKKKTEDGEDDDEDEPIEEDEDDYQDDDDYYQGNAYDDDEEYGDVDDGGDEGALY